VPWPDCCISCFHHFKSGTIALVKNPGPASRPEGRAYSPEGGPGFDLPLERAFCDSRRCDLEVRSQKSEVRSQNKMMSLRAYTFYIFRLSRRRIPYSEFCLLNPVFLSTIFTAEPSISDLALRGVG
jgi:hypothetical protein